MVVNADRLNELLGKAVVDFGATFHAALVRVGDKLGLYKALAAGGPQTAAELAERTGLRRWRCLCNRTRRKWAGLVWEVCDPSYFREVMPIEAGRWGVGFRLPMISRENARRNLESILPELKLRWADCKSRFTNR